MPKPTAIVYVDGFNLYKGRIEKRPEWKWLDVGSFARDVLNDFEVIDVHYFTASVRAKANPRDPRAPDRQHALLRALEGTGVRVHRDSNFSMQPSSARMRAGDRNDDLGWVDIWKVQEKGTDVKLAVQLLLDSMDRLADSYWIVSSDSDLASAIAASRTRFGARVGVVYPRGEESGEFRKLGVESVHVHDKHLASNQLSDPALTQRGSHVHRPKEWRKQ